MSDRERRLRTGALATGGGIALVAAVLMWPTVVEPAAAGAAMDSQPERGLAAATTTAPEVPATEPKPPAAADEQAGLLATASARLEDRTLEAKPLPVGLRIDALSVAAPINAVGGLANGEMEVPAGIHEVAWYEHGPSPGQPGSAVLAAHVDMAGQGPGVFFNLSRLERGNTIAVDFSDGATQTFEVVDAATYHKRELDRQRIFMRNGPPVLTLITCGGDFNPSLRRYDSNVVVYAVPAVGGEEDPT